MVPVLEIESSRELLSGAERIIRPPYVPTPTGILELYITSLLKATVARGCALGVDVVAATLNVQIWSA